MKGPFRLLLCLSILGVALLAGCRPVSRVNAALGDVESYINEAPDSARTVLQSMDSTLLRTKRLRARYALLRTMAQDKCYDDITTPGLLDPAADWLARHGSPDERMKVWFYRGRISVDQGNMNEAAIAFSRSESYADKVQDKHALGVLYSSFQSVYGSVYNRPKEQEYAEKSVAVFRETDDQLLGPSLGLLAIVYHEQRKWELADSVFREAMPYFEDIPALAPRFLSDYAQMKVEQPLPDPAGAIELLDRYRAYVGSFGALEAGVYAYASALLGDMKTADQIIPGLKSLDGAARYAALVWVAQIHAERNDYQAAYWEQAEVYRSETEYIQKALDNSVAQVLRDEAARQAEDTRNHLRMMLIYAGGIFFALLSVVLLLLLRKEKLKVERDRLMDAREQMQEELERVQEESEEKSQLLSGQEDRIREMEEHVARERETYTRERVNRLRQLGELRSTFWWRERGGMRESDAIQRIKKEISYVYQTDNDGVALVRRLDAELDGAVSQLRKKLHLRGKPQEVLFLCCCILDLEPEMIAEIMNTSKANVYEKRSRLRARIRELGDPLLAVLVDKK